MLFATLYLCNIVSFRVFNFGFPSPLTHAAGRDLMIWFCLNGFFDSLTDFVFFNFPIMPPTTRKSAAFFLQKFWCLQIVSYICSVDFTPFLFISFLELELFLKC